MKFDDFNYEVYNPYILVEERPEEKKARRERRKLGIDSEDEEEQAKRLEQKPEKSGLSAQSIEG